MNPRPVNPRPMNPRPMNPRPTNPVPMNPVPMNSGSMNPVPAAPARRPRPGAAGFALAGGFVLPPVVVAALALAAAPAPASAAASPIASPVSSPAASPAASPTASAGARPQPRGAVELSGSGSATRRITLDAGLWTVEMRVRNNFDRSFGTPVEDNFVVEVESTSAAGGAELLANEIAGAWSASATLRVGGGGFAMLPAGRQILSVDASGDWEITLRPESRRSPASDPAASPDASGRLRLSGSGTATRRIRLDSGLWTVALQVSGNLDRTFGSAIEDNFIVEIESAAGEGAATLANEIASRWTGSETLRVGRGFLALTPGVQVVSVDATGAWQLVFQRE